MNLFPTFTLRNWRGDLYGGVTAAVVSLPLALAFGESSGAGAMAGLYSAIFVGFFAALFGGTPCQVSGPTGPMTVVMALVMTQFVHDPAMAFTVVIMGGLLQMSIGALGMGRFINFVPFSVISGFMTGIGCVVIILQLPPFVGYGVEKTGVLEALSHFPVLFTQYQPQELLLGVITLTLVIFWPRALNRIAPAAIVALIICTAVAVWFLPGVSTIGEIPTGLPEPQLPRFSLEALPFMIHGAVTLALLASIDSLLTSLIADTITRTHHDSNRELIGQGLGNCIAGAFGGIPGAGSTMLTLGNARSGGATPLAGMIHSLLILAVVLGFGSYAAWVPHAVLAGILLKLGMDIIDWQYLKRLRNAPKGEVAVMVTVVMLTVFVNLITAVAIGIILVTMLQSRDMLEHEMDQLQFIRGSADDTGDLPVSPALRAQIEAAQGDIMLLHFNGPFSFASAKELVRRVRQWPAPQTLILDFSGVKRFDTSAAMAIEEILQHAQALDCRVLISGMSSAGGQYLERLNVMQKLDERQRFQNLDAVAAALA